MEDEIAQTRSQQLADLEESAKRRLAGALADNTKRAYRSDVDHFDQWCSRHGLDALPAVPRTVHLYINALADDGYKASTIQRRLSSIRKVHRAAGEPDPCDSELVSQSWKAIRRDDDVEVAQEGRSALLTDQIHSMVDSLDGGTDKVRRDRALILIGFATGARRSELAALDVEDLEFRPEGVLVTIRQSKTDQTGQGRVASVHYGNGHCPVRALREYLDAAGIDSGAVFRTTGRWGNVRDNRISGKSINRAVKSAADAAGLDASKVGAHSLRAGHVTQRKVAGDSNDAIMDQTGHKSESTMRRYDRAAKEFRHDVSASLGL